MTTVDVWIGTDRRETDALLVSAFTFLRAAPVRYLTPGIAARFGYSRHVDWRNGVMYDRISDAPMSTEFAISRFVVPRVWSPVQWSIFVDCDTMLRGDLGALFAELDDSKALMCVQHDYTPSLTLKMDNQPQTAYPRKNWSSVMAFNRHHPANDRLTMDMVNGLPGRDLHRFCWLDDHEIGALSPRWNYLVGTTELRDDIEPSIVHYTLGVPSMPGRFDDEYADEWWSNLECAIGRIRF